MAKVLVTGGAGFIGSAVVRQLVARGRDVRVLCEPGVDRGPLATLPVESVEGSVLDSAALDRALAGCDALYHLAAVYRLWMPDATRMWDVNVEGTTAVMLAARRAGVRRVVYTSSIAAIGLTGTRAPADETTAFNTFPIAGDYVLSKHVSERVVQRFAADGLPVVIVNPALPFGAGDRGPTPTGRLALLVLRGEVPALAPGGISVADVETVALGHVLAEERGRVGERYILTDHNVTVEAFVRLVASAGGVPVPRLRIPTPLATALAWGYETWSDVVTHAEPRLTVKATRYALQYAWYAPDKARRELGLPSVPLAETIARAVAFFRANGMA
jgi:dihydroflavonol-4-reductase